MGKGFIEGIISDMEMHRIVDKSRNADGTVNVDQALGVAWALGYTSFEDQALIIRMAEIENEKLSNNR